MTVPGRDGTGMGRTDPSGPWPGACPHRARLDAHQLAPFMVDTVYNYLGASSRIVADGAVPYVAAALTSDRGASMKSGD